MIAALGRRQAIVDSHLGRKPGAAGVDHFDLKALPAGNPLHRPADRQIGRLRPSGVAERFSRRFRAISVAARFGTSQEENGRRVRESHHRAGTKHGAAIERLRKIERFGFRRRPGDDRPTQGDRTGGRIVVGGVQELDGGDELIAEKGELPLDPPGKLDRAQTHPKHRENMAVEGPSTDRQARRATR